MKLLLTIAITALTFSSANAAGWPAVDDYMNASFVCGNHPKPADCEYGMVSFPDDYEAAKNGDYQGQRNVAFCFQTGCDWAVRENQTLACAWRVVILASGHLEVDSGDQRNAELACGKLDGTARRTAERQADRMLKLLGVE